MDLKALFTPFPVLSTPRLVLRALRPTDLSDLYEYASDPEIDQHVPWVHYKAIEEARENLNEFLEEYVKDGLGAWGIEHRADQKLIGILNCSLPHRIIAGWKWATPLPERIGDRGTPRKRSRPSSGLVLKQWT